MAAAAATARVVALRQQLMSGTYAMFQTFPEPVVIERAHMQYMYDKHDRRYLDLLANNLTISVGHGHARVTEALRKQMEKAVHTSSMYYSEPAAVLSEKLVATMPKRSDGHPWQVLFAVSGTEAVELAVHLARAYTGAQSMISLQNSYHGSYGTAMGASGIHSCKHQFPETQAFVHLPAPIYENRGADKIDGLIATGRGLIESSTSRKVAGVILEPVQGYGGIHVLPAEYMRRAAALAREFGGVVISDEIQSGLGRMGDVFWSYEMSNIEPDIIVAAKGLGNGLPVSAVIAAKPIFDKLIEMNKWVFSTYGANPMICAGANAVLDTLKEERYQEHVTKMGRLVGGVLNELLQRYSPAMTDVRGHGLMWGIEMEPAIAAKLFSGMKDNQVLVGLGGARKNVLRFMPPMCVNEGDLENFRSTFIKVMSQA